MFEVEQKFRVADTSAVEDELASLGASIEAPVTQIDRYFAHPARDFMQTDEALRIRQVGEQNRITYKGPKIDQTTKTRREIELPLAAGQPHARQFAELLKALGFEGVATVQKSRRKARLRWQDFDVEVALDSVEGLGHFVELDITAAEEQVDEARSALAGLAGKLGLKERDGERLSYLELLLQRQG